MQGHNFPIAAFLLELELQAKIAIHAFEALDSRIIGWRAGASGSAVENRISPLEAIIYCTALVSAVAMIGKTLQPTQKSPASAKKRGQALSDLIGNAQLNLIFDMNARNSNEHLDERLDKFLQGFESGSFHYAIKMDSSENKAKTFVPRQLNPDSLQLKIAGDTLDLKACHNELQTFCGLLDKAFNKLEVERHELYAT